ncbi:MAG: HD domain-containing phosphohydrolase [Colwellia sp.]
MTKKNPPLLLIVDDIPANIDVLRAILKSNYKIKIATSGEKALSIVKESPPDLILLDIMMPDMDGFEVCRLLKKNINSTSIPIIFVTAKSEVANESKGFALGAVDYITKPINPAIVLARVRTHIALNNEKILLNELVMARTKVLNATRLKIIHRLGRAAEYKDNETGLHVIRMSKYAHIIALASGVKEEKADVILSAAPMHDIGKIGIPDAILLKPGKLTSEEFNIIKRHPQIGADILGDEDEDETDSSHLLNMARSIALTHHEKWDGSGYPNGLAGKDIPLHSRIVMIADVFDALTTARPYKEAWPVDKAVNLIKEEAGSHFDPQLVEVFLDVLPKILKIKSKYAELQAP